MVAILVLQFEGTWTNGTDNTATVGYAFLQCPSLGCCIVASEVAYLVTAVAIELIAANLSQWLTYSNPVVLTNLGRSPAGVLTEVVHGTKALDLILVETDVTCYVNAPVLLLNSVPCDRELKTLVLGLTHVTILCVVTSTCYRELDKQVLCSIDVCLNVTIDLTTEESEVETQVTGDGCLPLQVGISHCLGWSPIVCDSIDPCSSLISVSLNELTYRDVVVTCSTVAETELQVVKPSLCALHEWL